MLKKYFDYLAILDDSNQQLNLNAIDVLLLNYVAKAEYENRKLNVMDLLLQRHIASQAAIHGRLKKLVGSGLIELKENKSDGRVKGVTLTKLARKRYEILSKAIA
ncbi:Winged helix DNA-binding domain-containing protein [Polynucleobacter meluiroseus]|uniref:Winged helix DNA-binding domain-containing protein n=1 Tax=Polynucleobacter meluiroseus TaxID=1938814 RepID=A0A240E016_9BURK|nr:helix-turn-helix domain-containing protein [Polynucleobacter meluiroseus]SNX28778.1 Winged helix DNA-binding domain-containing protein [Polynucleobacter meluiroseus]